MDFIDLLLKKYFNKELFTNILLKKISVSILLIDKMPFLKKDSTN